MISNTTTQHRSALRELYREAWRDILHVWLGVVHIGDNVFNPSSTIRQDRKVYTVLALHVFNKINFILIILLTIISHRRIILSISRNKQSSIRIEIVRAMKWGIEHCTSSIKQTKPYERYARFPPHKCKSTTSKNETNSSTFIAICP